MMPAALDGPTQHCRATLFLSSCPAGEYSREKERKRERVGDLLREVDADGDGCISLKEFAHMLDKYS